MGKLHTIKRRPGEITVEILHVGEVINGKFVAAGNIKVVSGMVHERYWLTPEVAVTNYEPDDDFLTELRQVNDGKL